MDSHSSSLSFELRIIRARNTNFKSSRDLFVRCYLPAGSNKKVRLDSQQISSNSNLTWNQTFSLNCLLDEDSLKSLKKGTIILELRSRKSTTSFMAKMSGSTLIARSEMHWKDVLEAKNMEIEKWAVMITKKSHVYNDDVKPPAVQIGIKVEEGGVVIGRKKACDECGCNGDCNSCVDYDYFLH